MNNRSDNGSLPILTSLGLMQNSDRRSSLARDSESATNSGDDRSFADNLRYRHFKAAGFKSLFFVAAILGVVVLLVLIGHTAFQGWQWLSFDFLTNFPSRFPEKAGLKSALWGSIWLMALTGAFAVPAGVGAAVYFEEFAPRNTWTKIIEINISNLAGVPSVVYGILGLAIFVRYMNFERSILSGALTMATLSLPVIIIASREALKSVPKSVRLAAYALGATKWQTVRAHVLPSALPGIMTGLILAMSRAIGEAAPLIMIGALSYIAFVPEGPMDSFTALPVQIYNWAARPQAEFNELAAAGILVLLAVLLSANAVAIYLRQRNQRKLQW